METRVGIIGAGPAGISAAVQLKRYKIDSIVFEKRKIGGLIENAYRVENTMLYPNGLPGKEFVKILEKYAEKYRLEVIYENVKNVKLDEGFIVETKNNRYKFEYLIVATGTRPKKLKFHNINYHITEIKSCDKILIIGGGDIAFDYALSSIDMCDEVTLLYRSEIKALPVLVDEVIDRGVNILKGEVKNIEGKNVITTAGTFKVDNILAAIGRIPNIEIVDGINHPKMFLIGDVKNGIYRQTSLAISDGIRTAMQIWRDVEGDKNGDTERGW